MTEFYCLLGLTFALIFGTLVLCFAAAYVSGQCSEEERKGTWK